MRIVAFGGGHGLAATLRALHLLSAEADFVITAVVTIADDGGSSGRLRADRGVLPPGDLRQALVALAADDPLSLRTAELLQHRFGPVLPGTNDSVAGHAVGNLLLCGLMELYGDPVAALDHAGALLRTDGRVLPMSREPVAIEADIRGADPTRPDDVVQVTGQHAVAVAPGRLETVRLIPDAPPACAEAIAAIRTADWLIFGPGSWYTSVIPHLLVPELAAAAVASPARRLVLLNLATEIETVGLSLAGHLGALARYAPKLHIDRVLADTLAVGNPQPVERAAESLGARLVLDRVAVPGSAPRHDPVALAAALVPVLGAAR